MDHTYFEREKPEVTKFSEKIFLNQLGYFCKAKKTAVITEPAERFVIEDKQGNVVFQNQIVKFGVDQLSMDDVYLADFTTFDCPGSYILRTDRGEASMEFTIGEDVYDKSLCDMIRAFYYLRCGLKLEDVYAGKFSHEVCHSGKAVLWENHEIVLDVSGGWHDAGDYGRYVTAGACALAHLLYAYQLFPRTLHEIDLNLPESHGILPDYLAECKVELDWILKMQRVDGAVYHKATTKRHAQFVMPEKDREQMYVFPITSLAAADLAAVCALAFRVYRNYDEEYSRILLSAAKKAGEWLYQNPDFIQYRNPKGCNTGEYLEYTDADNRFWAYAELYAATGDEKWKERMEEAMKCAFSLTDLGYHSIGGLGTLSYLTSDQPKDPVLMEQFRSTWIKRAEELKIIADQCGYGAAMLEEDYTWGSNMHLLKHGMTFAIVDQVLKVAGYKEYAAAQLHYLFGKNASGYSFVTGQGWFFTNYPHYRPSFADGIEECMPGFVSGGPNRHPVDADAKLLIPLNTPPMKCYVDDVGCYSLNEITIYWNSPAVFLLAYLLENREQ